MADKIEKTDKKEEIKKDVAVSEQKIIDNKKSDIKDEIKSDVKDSEKKEEKKEEKHEVKAGKKETPKITKKEEAVANAVSVHMSKRHGMYISSFIKGKKIDDAISDLNKVIKIKKAVPFKGEIPHRKGMMSGRYPVNASKIFISVLKALKGNVIVNGMDLDKTRIYFATSNLASRPARRGGKAKRAHITLKAKEFNIPMKQETRKEEKKTENKKEIRQEIKTEVKQEVKQEIKQTTEAKK